GEEVLPHVAPVAVRAVGHHRVVLVEVERRHRREVDFPCPVPPDQLTVDPERGAAGGEPQHAAAVRNHPAPDRVDDALGEEGGEIVVVGDHERTDALALQASSAPAPAHHDSKLDVDSTLRRWGIQIVQGSRFVGSRASEGYWVVAPVRTRPPSPPPEGRERRSRERLTLELAGLCLGLLDRRELPAAPVPKRTDPLQDLATLPGIIAHEVSNPLTAARAGLQLAMEALGRWTEVAAARRLEMLDELGQVVDDIDRGINFLRAIKDRARGTLARSERFDAVRVVRSCCTLESRVLRDKKIPLEFDSTLDEVYLKGD